MIFLIPYLFNLVYPPGETDLVYTYTRMQNSVIIDIRNIGSKDAQNVKVWVNREAELDDQFLALMNAQDVKRCDNTASSSSTSTHSTFCRVIEMFPKGATIDFHLSVNDPDDLRDNIGVRYGDKQDMEATLANVFTNSEPALGLIESRMWNCIDRIIIALLGGIIVFLLVTVGHLRSRR